ncbi:Uncharacterised protein [Serratia fonticola]|nr:Uncharacterised protein [Serratia fonticola]
MRIHFYSFILLDFKIQGLHLLQFVKPRNIKKCRTVIIKRPAKAWGGSIGAAKTGETIDSVTCCSVSMTFIFSARTTSSHGKIGKVVTKVQEQE